MKLLGLVACAMLLTACVAPGHSYYETPYVNPYAPRSYYPPPRVFVPPPVVVVPRYNHVPPVYPRYNHVTPFYPRHNYYNRHHNPYRRF